MNTTKTTIVHRPLAPLTLFLLPLLILSCAGSRSNLYPDFGVQKESIRELTLVVDIFAGQYGLGSGQTIVLSANQDMGNFLVDTVSTLLSQRGYSVTRMYPAVVGYSAQVQRIDLLQTIDGRDTTIVSSPPLFVPANASRDSVFQRAMRAFDIAHSRKTGQEHKEIDSSWTSGPLDVLVYVYAYGDEVSTARGLTGAIIGGVTGMSRGIQDWHSTALEIVDLSTGRTLYRDMTGKGNRPPSKENFLRHLTALIERLPMRGPGGSR